MLGSCPWYIQQNAYMHMRAAPAPLRDGDAAPPGGEAHTPPVYEAPGVHPSPWYDAETPIMHLLHQSPKPKALKIADQPDFLSSVSPPFSISR